MIIKFWYNSFLMECSFWLNNLGACTEFDNNCSSTWTTSFRAYELLSIFVGLLCKYSRFGHFQVGFEKSAQSWS